jgi:hypothetical protein
MVHGMDLKLQNIDREITLMLRQGLTVRNLQLRVFAVVEQLAESRPKEKSRRSLLEWLHIN